MNLDKTNRYLSYATGKRKTAVAKVWIYESKDASNSMITVNNKTVSQYFGREYHVDQVVKPTTLIETTSYKLRCIVKGSGMTGQAGAISHAISKALSFLDEENRKVLRKHGLLTRDSRQVERKKYGQPKARKKYQFSKR